VLTRRWDPSGRTRLLCQSTCVALAAVAVAALGAGRAQASGDVNRVACGPTTEASPGFRSFLPDCRAYELVTPPYKGASSVGILDKGQLISTDGTHLIGRSFGGFAGTENNEHANGLFNSAIYLFSRTPSGWTTEALAPPASQNSHGEFLAASASFAQTLWSLNVQQGTNEEVLEPRSVPYNLAVREPDSNGKPQFVPIGPEQPGAGHEFFAFAGASDDLGHVAFELVGGGARRLWPGDTTQRGGASLYEYVGTANSEPRLVGVTNVGALHGVASVNEHAALISQCGTELGGGEEGTAYDAVSANGSSIYFTALHENRATAEPCASPAVDEVYARIDGSATVPISGFKSADCTGACASAEPRPGVFAGASEDGSRAFFTTAQPLLNSDTDASNDLYMAQVSASGVQSLVQVSRGGPSDPTPGHGAKVIGVARSSPDGSHVYFVAQGVLTTSPNDHGDAAEAGAFNLYDYDVETGGTEFVANLATKAELTPELEAECEVEKGGGFNPECEQSVLRAEASRLGFPRADSRPFQTSVDGRFLLFVSARDLTAPEDTSTAVQVFEYDAQANSLTRISVGQKSPAFPGGYNADGNTTNAEDFASILVPTYNRQDLPAGRTSALSVADDGTVVFTSRLALAPSASDGVRNVYEYREGNVYLISAGEDRGLEEAVFGEDFFQPGEERNGRLLGISGSGTDVFFAATGALVPADGDSQADWYSARADGGFPGQVASVGCSGEECHGPPSANPSLPFAGSSSQPGGGNLAPPVATPTVSPTTRAQELAKALRACRAKHDKPKRTRCERSARRKYGRSK
jgi:hypothetical protein